jgi:spermidine synthase
MPRQSFLNRNTHLLATAFAAGFGSIVSQSVIIRILWEIYTGNELVTGVILCNWLLLTAAGAFLISLWLRRNSSPPLLLIMGIAAVMPLLGGFSIDFFRNTLFESGVIVSFTEIFFSSFLLLLPFCLLNGALFPMLVARMASEEEGTGLARIYSLESIGSIIGGLLFGTILVHFLSNFESLLIVLLLYLFVIGFVLFFNRKPLKAIIPI